MVVCVIPMTGVISKDPVNGECVQGYELTKDAKKCVRAQEVDCNNEPNSPLCTGEKGRGRSILCDEYAQLTGSRIAYGGYNRNDTPENYCVNYQDGKWNFCANADICDDEGSKSSTDPDCTEKGSPCPENYIRYGDYCARYRADCGINPTNVYCDGSRRSDGFTNCDKPDHPGYKFCKSD